MYMCTYTYIYIYIHIYTYGWIVVYACTGHLWSNNSVKLFISAPASRRSRPRRPPLQSTMLWYELIWCIYDNKP